MSQANHRARAAETKRQRTRGKLIRAADEVMREDGWGASVEAIARASGVSVPTFYNLYRSRNQLCIDAFRELILEPLTTAESHPQTPSETARMITQLCEDRKDLVGAALAGRLEKGLTRLRSMHPDMISSALCSDCSVKAGATSSSPAEGTGEAAPAGDFVDEITAAFWKTATFDQDSASATTALFWLRAAILELLDAIAHGDAHGDHEMFDQIVEMSHQPE